MTLPLNARRIILEWPITEGGFGVTAHTDIIGQPIIGLYPLNREGEPAGKVSEYGYRHLMIRLVAGYDEYERALIVFADIELSMLGLSLRVHAPHPIKAEEYDRFLFAKWGSPLPHTYGLPPANSNWPERLTSEEIKQ